MTNELVPPTTTPDPNTPTSAKRALVAACLGNTLEWFDWVIYAQFAAIIATNFFPAENPHAALLGTLAIFATGFFFRPLGGLVLTALADRWGRRAGLIISVTCMAGGAAAISIVPGYTTIGLLAPVILFLARALQGFSTGGEFSSIGSYLAEVAPDGHRGLYGSLHYVSATVGSLAAMATAWFTKSLIDPDTLANWAWRIPFAVGAVLGLLTLWLRRNMEESRAFDAVAPTARKPLIDTALLWRHRGPMLRLFMLSGYVGVWYYTFASYLPVYMTGKGLSAGVALGVGSLALALFTVALPFVGALSDRVGRRPLLIGCVAISTLTAVPLMTLLGSSGISLFAVQLLALLIFALYAAIGPVAMAEQFPTEVRSIGAGFPYSLAVAVFGGTAPLLLEWLSGIDQNDLFPWYLALVSALALVAVAGLRESYRTDLEDTE